MAVVEVGIEQLQAALALGAKLIDVREPPEYASAHVVGAVLIPLNSVPDRIDDFRGATPTYLICRSGIRSLNACEYLAENGIEAINVAGGMLDWIDHDQPVVRGSSV